MSRKRRLRLRNAAFFRRFSPVAIRDRFAAIFDKESTSDFTSRRIGALFAKTINDFTALFAHFLEFSYNTNCIERQSSHVGKSDGQLIGTSKILFNLRVTINNNYILNPITGINKVYKV